MESSADWPPPITRVPRKPKVAQFCAAQWPNFTPPLTAGIVGSGGLGQAIYDAIRTLDIAKSIDAAIAIVILTIVIDRLTQSLVQKKEGTA